MNRLDTNNTQVFLIGITAYENDGNLHPLDSAFDNVAELRKLLFSRLIGIPRSNITHQIDPSDKTRLLKNLTKIAKREGTDNIILYYSGHGVLDDQDNLYLALSNSTVDEIYNDGLSIEELDKTLSRLKLNIILILDCCFSERAFEKFRQRNYCVLASSAKNETSKYPMGEEFSAFTHELIEVLYNGIKDGNNYLTFKDIYNAVTNGLSNKHLPKPKIASTNSIEDLYFAQNNSKIQVMQKNNILEMNHAEKGFAYELEKALHTFDYSEQKDFFEDYLEKRNVGAFIIHGKNGYGQKWLFKRLLLLHQIHSPAKLTHPNNYGKETNFEGVLETLKEEFKRAGGRIRFQREDSLENRTEKIRSHIFQILKAGDNVIIGFRNLFKLMPKENIPVFIEGFINRFWISITKQAEEIIKENKQNKKCLLFFVEDEEISDCLYEYCSQRIEECENKILVLPAIQPLCENTLFDWIKYVKSFECQELRNKFRKYSLEDCTLYLRKCVENTHTAFFDELYCEFNLSFEEC